MAVRVAMVALSERFPVTWQPVPYITYRGKVDLSFERDLKAQVSRDPGKQYP